MSIQCFDFVYSSSYSSHCHYHKSIRIAHDSILQIGDVKERIQYVSSGWLIHMVTLQVRVYCTVVHNCNKFELGFPSGL